MGRFELLSVSNGRSLLSSRHWTFADYTSAPCQLRWWQRVKHDVRNNSVFILSFVMVFEQRLFESLDGQSRRVNLYVFHLIFRVFLWSSPTSKFLDAVKIIVNLIFCLEKSTYLLQFAGICVKICLILENRLLEWDSNSVNRYEARIIESNFDTKLGK